VDKARDKCASAWRDEHGFVPSHSRRPASGEDDPGDHRAILIPLLKVEGKWGAKATAQMPGKTPKNPFGG
jgi:hypothetical protein